MRQRGGATASLLLQGAREEDPTQTDLLIVGGGINGVGIARDAAGRGLRVVLCEQGDLGCATSSASSKLVHGGLRYLEQLEFRLVAESLAEREVLLYAAPHLVRPMRFVMPHAPGLRPRWMIRAGLYLYDHLARRQTLAPSAAVDLTQPPYSDGLKSEYAKGYAYSDCWVDDARLVIANARAAAEAGAVILPRTKCIYAERNGARWTARLRSAQGELEVSAVALVNAAGPWAEQFVNDVLHEKTPAHLKLVQGSHIVVPRLYAGEHAYILQNDDRRVVFCYPYEGVYTLVGTTDVALDSGSPGECAATADEIEYLCRAANRYFRRQIAPRDARWSYAGVRALADDGSRNPSKVTRDYLLALEDSAGNAPLLSVFGGKITTYRPLAERALENLAATFPQMGPAWTSTAKLPGGDLGRFEGAASQALSQEFPQLPATLLKAFARRHGSRVPEVLRGATTIGDLGQHFGADLYAREVDYLLDHEWAHGAEDILWRRTKAGLHLSNEEQAELVRYVAANSAACVT